ncbi:MULTISPECIES: hypothetical protein [unclassified Nocardiopsis]|uniref:hypothetical protein n=1 Tax=unclassified Nocardiopsis TaxID=2649073 RepID=UPI00135917B9|nr:MULTISPECIES: hypothetical protein [unclassified Nocardiopsis]
MAQKYRGNRAYGRTAAVGLAAAGALAAPAYAADEFRGVEQVPSPPADQGARVGLVLEADAKPPRPGQEVTLRTTVANDDAEPVEGALLAQHVPTAVEIVEVGGDGVVNEGIVNWNVDVPAGEEAVYTLRVRAPEGGERLTSTACLLLDRNSDPTACASDTVDVTEATVAWRVSEFTDRDGLLRAAGAAALAGLAWVLWRRRRAAGRG